MADVYCTSKRIQFPVFQQRQISADENDPGASLEQGQKCVWTQLDCNTIYELLKPEPFQGFAL